VQTISFGVKLQPAESRCLIIDLKLHFSIIFPSPYLQFHNISFFKKPIPGFCGGEDKKVFQKLVVPRGRFFDEYWVSTDILQLELPKDIAIIVRSL